MGRIGPLGIWELLIILLVVLLIFGARRLPEMARGIGQSVKEFRKGIRDDVEAETADDDSGRQSTGRNGHPPGETPATTKSS